MINHGYFWTCLMVPTTAIVSCSKQHMWGTRQKIPKTGGAIVP